MDFKIAVIKGDGVGPEIVDEGLKVLDKIAQKYNHKFECTNVLGGGAAKWFLLHRHFQEHHLYKC